MKVYYSFIGYVYDEIYNNGILHDYLLETPLGIFQFDAGGNCQFLHRYQSMDEYLEAHPECDIVEIDFDIN